MMTRQTLCLLFVLYWFVALSIIITQGVDELFVGVARAAIRVHRNHSAAASPTRGNNPLKGGKEQVSLKAASGGGKANKPCC
jgi:hypothetical protein